MFLYTLRPDLTLESTTTLPGGAGGDRFMGELSAAPNGRLDASFWDRSYSGNQLVDLTYATSSDGGHTWRQTNVTPLATGYDPSQWGVPSGTGFRPFIGDYNGIASTNAFAAMTWTVWLRRSRSTSRSTSPRRRRAATGAVRRATRRQALFHR